MKHLLTRSAKITLEVLLFIVLLVAIILGCARAFFPHLDRYKPYFEQWATAALHQPIKINHIQASWKGLHPLINMEEVDILDANNQQPQLHIQRLQAGINVISSLWQQRFVPSSMTVIGTQIQAHRIDATTLDVNGIKIPLPAGETPTADVGNMIGWLLNQGNIKLENIDIQWQDQHNRIWHLADLTAGLNHGWFKNQVIGAATLMEAAPARFRFVINITQLGPGSQQVRANCYLFIKDFDLTPWLKELPISSAASLTQGKLDRLRLWATWENNEWQQLQAVVALQQAKLTTEYLNQPLNIDELSGNLAWEHHTDGFSFAVDQMKLKIDQQFWPVTEVSVQQSQKDQAPMVQIVRANQFDLQQLSALIARLKIADRVSTPSDVPKEQPQQLQWQSYLNALQPQGKLENILVRREVSTTGITALSASSDFNALKVQASGKIPAVTNLQGSVQLTPTTGNLKLEGHALEINAPAWFSHPFHLALYQGEIQWSKLADGFNIQASHLQMADNNLGLQTDFTLWMPNQANDSPYLRFLASFSERDSYHLRDYIPTGILKTHLALETWLTEAFVAGEGAEGQITLQGPLAHFPFDDHSGRFNAAVKVKDMYFNYKTGWPNIQHLNATAIFNGRSLNIEATPGATILGANAGVIQAQIPNLAQAELTVQGNVQSDMQQGLDFIAQSPLQKTIGEGLENLALQGAMKLDLGLHIPLHKGGESSTVLGNVLVAPNGKLSVPAWKIHLNDFTGAFKFTENSFSADKLTATWLGQPVNIQVDTKASQDDHIIQAHIQSHATVAAIEKEYGLGALKNKLSGEADYSALLQLSRKQGHSQMVLGIDSNLQGVAINLPEPLKKAANEKLPTHVETKTLEKSALSLWIDYAKRLTATLDFSKQPQKNWSFKQGDIHFNADTPSALGAILASANIQIQPKDQAWVVQVDSPNAQGNVTIPEDISMAWIGKFTRFRVMPGGISQTVSGINPGDIPPLDLQFQNFYYGEKPFGAVSLLTSSGKNVLQIQRLKVDSEDTQILAAGRWEQNDAKQQQTTLSGNLTSDNIGAALKRWQVTSSVANGNGRAAFALSWPSAAYDFSFKQLNGSLSLNFNKGSIVNISDEKAAEMGIGRILNLLSLQSIPRRLTLDFSDLLQKGFAFDVMKGDFNMQTGNAITNNAYLNGPIAKVEIKGRIGMADKDYNLLMATTPYVTSSLPVAATIVGGPIAGAATWLGSKVLSGVVNSITTHTYQVTGSWDKPVIETTTKNIDSPP